MSAAPHLPPVAPITRPKQMFFIVLMALCWSVFYLLAAAPVSAADPPVFKAADLEFFEKDVRPILSRRCYSCHSAKAKKVQGGLRVDSRAAMLKGGDTGPAIIAGKPKESLLIDAINYGEIYEMPPKSKMPAKEIAALTRWVELGAPWPDEKIAAGDANEFDIHDRLQSHWAWRPITTHPQPKVDDPSWPSDPLDYFILAKLDAAKLKPASDADRRTLIRRVYFDLIGLPPSVEEVEAFVADDSPEAYQRVVTRLLDSPRFGERWGRHWLDLVRYAESRGHEFDYNTPNAHQYRDYVIRALNDDVPYDQFVIEHVAGDLLEKPRVHPQSGANESVLATGFWYLGEWCHSPVDIRKDETDRFDNMVDVFSKTFLGLTVACARCHDHKFDAISQADYYALVGYLQSSAYRQVRFESLAHNQRIAAKAAQAKAELGPKAIQTALQVPNEQWPEMEKYLNAAFEVLQASRGDANEVVFEDFEDGDYAGWTATGEAFRGAPQDARSIAQYQGDVRAQGKFFLNSHNLRNKLGQTSRHSDSFTGRLKSEPFKLTHNSISMLIGGGAHAGTCVNLLTNGKVVRTASGRNQNAMHSVTWSVVDLLGQEVQFEVVDEVKGGWGNIGLDHIVLRNEPGSLRGDSSQHVNKVAATRRLDAQRLLAWCRELAAASSSPSHPLRALSQSQSGRQPRLTQGLLVSHLSADDKNKNIEVITDFERKTERFIQDGVTFGGRAVRAGEVWVDGDKVTINSHSAARRSPLFRKLSLAPGAEKDAGRLAKYDRAGKTLRTPSFIIKPKRLFYLVRGRGLAYCVVDSHRMINGPLHGSLTREFDTKGKYEWVEHNMARYAKHNAHVEFIPLGEDMLDVAQVVQADAKPAISLADADEHDLKLTQQASRLEQTKLSQLALSAIRHSAQAILNGQPSTRDYARGGWLLAHHELLDEDQAAKVQQAKQALLQRLKDLEKEVRLTSQTSLAMWDGTALNETLLIRGNNRTPGDVVERRLPTALGGKTPKTAGSGRLQMARELFDPQNPFPARVMVNRIWHHLTGRGIAPEPDNFGVLGQPPTHPELLDHLAARFRQDKWSVKQMIRTIVLSRTYRMASTPSAVAAKIDPNNILLHRMRIRRLQAESIRDSILAISGRLDEKMYGRSVPVFLTPFMQGRGRPRGGPLDGAGRRSIYISVRRNFLSPLMLTFDTPQPFSTVGRRTVSNVPAQALILMNDPFIVGQSRLWAKRLLADKELDPMGRIQRAYQQAFARPATEEEVASAKAFLAMQAKELKLNGEQAKDHELLWGELCHVLMNVKEFIFVR